MIRYHEEIASLLHREAPPEAGLRQEQFLALLERPQKPEHGDIAFPCFQFAKALRKAPPQIAAELAAKLKDASPSFASVENLGPYLNFRLSAAAAAVFLREVSEKKSAFGHTASGKGKKVLVEYSSPNVAKPLHIGHFRTTMLGQTLSNLHRAAGYEVIALNHLGDWGSQFGAVAYAFLHMGGSEAKLAADPIGHLLELYVKFHAEEEKNPDLDREKRLLFKKIEEGDPELTKLWRRFCDLSIQELERTYARLGVKFDHIIGESFYTDKIPSLLADLRTKGLLVKSEGAEVVDLEAQKMPPCLIITGDGTTLYATRDLAAAIWRHKKFGFDRCLYVVGAEQILHFRQVFQVLDLMGFPWAKQLEHVHYGLYRFKDGKFSTRKGRIVKLTEVIDEARDKVREIIEAKNPDLANKEEVAEMVGLGAVVFNDLSTDRVKDVEFDWGTILNFEGDTGPYLQYTHARAASILRQAQAKGFTAPTKLPGASTALPACLDQPAALELIKQFGRLSVSIEGAIRLEKPSIIGNYLLELAKLFNAFYRNVKVLDESASRADTEAKLFLVAQAKQVLANALALLCMSAPEQM